MKFKVEFEVETDPIDKDLLLEYMNNWSEDIEYELRHIIKNYFSYDDLDEIFVKPKIQEI